jgi:hypothetical protein
VFLTRAVPISLFAPKYISTTYHIPRAFPPIAFAASISTLTPWATLAHVEKRGFCAIFLSSVIPVRHDGRRPVHFPNNRKLGGDQAEADQPYVHTARRSLPDIDRLRMREIYCSYVCRIISLFVSC